MVKERREAKVDWDHILKVVISETLKLFFRDYEETKVSPEFGLEVHKFRADLLVAKIGGPKLEFPKGSWLSLIADNIREFNIFEAKGRSEIINEKALHKVAGYKVVYSMTKEVPVDSVSAFIVGFRTKKKMNVSKILSGLRLEGSAGLYSMVGDRALEVHVIAIDELDPSVPGNEILCVLSEKEDVRLKAAEEVVRRYGGETFIFAITLLMNPEVSHMAEGVSIPYENIVRLVDLIGIDRLAAALGPEKLARAIDAVGIDRLAAALGPEKLARLLEAAGAEKLIRYLGAEGAERLILALMRGLPPEKRRAILEKAAGDGK